MKKSFLATTLILLLSVSPCFAIVFSYCTVGQGDSVVMHIGLTDVPESLITAGVFIEYDPLAMSIVATDINSGEGGWDAGMSQKVKDPKGPGTYMITAGNLSTVTPDDSSKIGIATIQVQCLTGSCSGQQIKVSTVPGFDSVVGNSSGVYDSDISPNYFYFDSPCTTSTTTTTISICDGSEDVCMIVGRESASPGSKNIPITVSLDNPTDRIKGVQFDLCDSNNSLTVTGCEGVGRASSFNCQYNASLGCTRVMLISFGGNLIEEGNGPILQISVDVSENALKQCINLKPENLIVSSDERIEQNGQNIFKPLNAGVDPGQFCITAFSLPVIEIRPSKVWKSRWIPLPHLMLITGKEISKESFVDLVFYPQEAIFTLPPLVWNEHYIWNLIWVMPGLGDEQGTVVVNLKDETLSADFVINGNEPIEWHLPSSFGSISPDEGAHESTIFDVTITGVNTTFQDDPPVSIQFSPQDGLMVSNITVINNNELEFDIEIAVDAPLGFKSVIITYDDGRQIIVGNNVFEVRE